MEVFSEFASGHICTWKYGVGRTFSSRWYKFADANIQIFLAQILNNMSWNNHLGHGIFDQLRSIKHNFICSLNWSHLGSIPGNRKYFQSKLRKNRTEKLQNRNSGGIPKYFGLVTSSCSCKTAFWGPACALARARVHEYWCP